MPLCDSFETWGVSATAKANGVSLNWNAVENASSYDVYRDGVKIATVSENKYDDVYYDTVDEIANPYVNLKHCLII